MVASCADRSRVPVRLPASLSSPGVHWFRGHRPLSRLVYPDLHSHRLDAIRDHLEIPPLPDRHRALPDTQLTAMIEEFSRGPIRGELGHDLLNALSTAAHGDPFLRGRGPAAETLLLLAIKAYDCEAHCAPAMRRGDLVLEGRSLHGIAVYQSLILNSGDQEVPERR
jgi:hypothetical protein